MYNGSSIKFKYINTHKLKIYINMFRKRHKGTIPKYEQW